jgi:hypothetical protein
MAQTISVFFYLFYLPGGGDFDCLKMRGAGRHRETHHLLSHAEILDVSGEETTLNVCRFTSKKPLSTCKIDFVPFMHAMKSCRENGVVTPRILNLDTVWR